MKTLITAVLLLSSVALAVSNDGTFLGDGRDLTQVPPDEFGKAKFFCNHPETAPHRIEWKDCPAIRLEEERRTKVYQDKQAAEQEASRVRAQKDNEARAARDAAEKIREEQAQKDAMCCPGGSHPLQFMSIIARISGNTYEVAEVDYNRGGAPFPGSPHYLFTATRTKIHGKGALAEFLPHGVSFPCVDAGKTATVKTVDGFSERWTKYTEDSRAPVHCAK